MKTNSVQRSSLAVIMLTTAFGLNFVWEMLQMNAYASMANLPWQATFLTCAVASLGDAGITGAVYLIIALAVRNWSWGSRAKFKTYIAAALVAGVGAIVIELVALKTGRWSYVSDMPKLPILGIGMLPLLQLTILVPLAIWIGWRNTSRGKARGLEDH